MVAQYTDRLKLEKQGINENTDTWGTRLNDGVIQLLDEAIAGVTTIAFGVTSGSKTILNSNGNQAKARNAVLVLTGAPSTNVFLNVPATEKPYIIRSKHTGSSEIRVRPSGAVAGAEVSLSPGGTTALVYVDANKAHRIADKSASVVISGESGVIFVGGSYPAFGIFLESNAVTNAKLEDMPAKTFKGNIGASAGDPANVSASQMLDTISSTTGDILIRSASGWTRLGIGASGTVIGNSGTGVPSYVVPSSGASAASVAEQITGSSDTVYTSPLTQWKHNSAVKAFARFDSSGTMAANYKVASISKLSTGYFRVNFSPSFTGAPCVVATVNSGGSAISTQVANITTSYADIAVHLIGSSPVLTDSFTNISVMATETATS